MRGLELVDERFPFRFKENFLGLADFLEEEEAEVVEVGEIMGESASRGLASPLFCVELVATVAREEGMLEVLL